MRVPTPSAFGKVGARASPATRVACAQVLGRILEVELELASSDSPGEKSSSKSLRFPLSYLRDNCASNFHPTTLQRLSGMNLASLLSRAESVSVSADKTHVLLKWEADDAEAESLPQNLAPESSFSAGWLLRHSLEDADRTARRNVDLRKIRGLTKEAFWAEVHADAFDFQQLVRADAQGESEVVRLFERVWRDGLAYVRNVDADVAAGADAGGGAKTGTALSTESIILSAARGEKLVESLPQLDAQTTVLPHLPLARLAQRAGFLRSTNYGTVFEVCAQTQPNNQAYTSKALGMHTDLPFYKRAPDIQMLHCVRQACQGGESRFVDGVAAAEMLRVKFPDSYEVLCKTKVRFSDSCAGKYALVDEKCTIQEENGFVTQVYYNEGVRCEYLDSLSVDEVDAFYLALARLRKIVEFEESLQIKMRMESNSMCIFNNCRVLHGRAAFTASAETTEGADANAFDGGGDSAVEGIRYLQGAYIEWDDVLSKIRVCRGTDTRVGHSD